ncbi:MAG: bis(5'-nucleosyl)-tetraphosphatase (symmetrical) YqeK [Candidatus Hydrogenedentes bacterium]|nr:bis(5'-nucleosyl)-tetraphosphatase (symmetrical) YqeK [Candidatus Hydrogenedentota bacterium]
MPIAKMPRYKEFHHLIRDRLPEEKVSHCIFVAEYAASLSDAAGVDHDDAVTAGMLHDLCRTVPGDDLLKQARHYGLNPSEAALEAPLLLHGPVAAEECRRDLDINSTSVYEAIYWHTTGRPDLDRLGQLLFLADFSEPTRRFPEAAQARALVRNKGFDAALLFVAEKKLVFQKSKAVLDPNLQAFLWWLQKS